jgi:hypothetical protein
MSRARLALVFLLLAGCHSSSSTDDGPLQPPAPGQGVQYEMVSSLDPGMEIERCELFVAPPEGLNINKETVRFSIGSHHVLLYTTSYTSFPSTDRHGRAVMPSTVYDCPDGAPADFQIVSVIGGAQSANAPNVVDLPSDTAVKVPGGTVLVMNTHYLNATPNPVDTDARINVYTIPDDQVQREAGIIFFYDPIIRVPAMSSAQARMACPANREYQIFNLQTHMHKRGLGGIANLTDGTNVLQQVYASTSWENVNVQGYDNLKIEAGQFFDYRCNYQSEEDHTILQGLTTKDEMCMLIGTYAPRNPVFEYCSLDGSNKGIASAATFFGNGSASCMDSVACIEQAKTMPSGQMQNDAFYACVLGSCEQAGPALTDMAKCEALNMSSQCKSSCSSMGKSCLACLHDACSTELSACSAATCS